MGIWAEDCSNGGCRPGHTQARGRLTILIEVSSSSIVFSIEAMVVNFIIVPLVAGEKTFMEGAATRDNGEIRHCQLYGEFKDGRMWVFNEALF